MASSGNLKKGTSVMALYKQLLGEDSTGNKSTKPSMSVEEAEKLRKRFGA